MIHCITCGSEFSCYDGVYICKEGHALKEGLEVTDTFSGSQRRIRNAKTGMKKDFFEEYNKFYKILIIHTCLFRKFKVFFNIQTDTYFKIYTKYVTHIDKKVYDLNSIITPSALFSIIYYSTRSEREKEGGLLLFNEFRRLYLLFPFMTIYKELLDSFNIKKLGCPSKSMKICQFTFKHTMNYCRLFSESKYNKMSTTHPMVAKTEDIDKYTTIKKIFRRGIRRDYEVFHKYMISTVEILGIEEALNTSKNLKISKFKWGCEFEFYLRKYVYGLNLNKKFFMAELEVCTLLFFFLIHFKIRINTKRAKFRINEKFYGGKENFCDFFESLRKKKDLANNRELIEKDIKLNSQKVNGIDNVCDSNENINTIENDNKKEIYIKTIKDYDNEEIEELESLFCSFLGVDRLTFQTILKARRKYMKSTMRIKTYFKYYKIKTKTDLNDFLSN